MRNITFLGWSVFPKQSMGIDEHLQWEEPHLSVISVCSVTLIKIKWRISCKCGFQREKGRRLGRMVRNGGGEASIMTSVWCDISSENKGRGKPRTSCLWDEKPSKGSWAFHSLKVKLETLGTIHLVSKHLVLGKLPEWTCFKTYKESQAIFQWIWFQENS